MPGPDPGARERSHWGWGWADKYADAGTIGATRAMASAILGFEPGPVPTGVPLAAAPIPPVRLAAPPDLHDIASTAAEARARHAYGRGWTDLWRAYTGDFAAAPDAVCYPRTPAEIAATLAWAEREGAAAIPYGGGTSVVRGTEAHFVRPRPAIVIDMARMSQVLRIERESCSALIEAGALGPQLEAALGAAGLTLRHYPQSFAFSTLGGWLATRAGGHFATVYTRIDHFVDGIEMVTPRGAWIVARRPSSGAGPDARWPIVGSEGALGVITRAWMRVQPRPTRRFSATVYFGEFAAGVATAQDIVQAGLTPVNCRLLDATEARLHGVHDDGKAVLLLGYEAQDDWPEPAMQSCLLYAARHGGECPKGVVRRDTSGDDGGGAGAWRQAFFEAPYLQSHLLRAGIMADTFETCCTWGDFPALDRAVCAAGLAAMKSRTGQGVICRRFTHVYPSGPAPYYTFVQPLRPGFAGADWQAVKDAVSTAIFAHGGTITHHHATGRTHRDIYVQESGPLPLAALRAVKAAVDPASVMNPGCLIPD